MSDITFAESIQDDVRARLERDIADSNPPAPLAVEDVFDFPEVLREVGNTLAGYWSRVGWDALDVDGLGDDEWIELTAASPHVLRPWVFCNVGCTQDIYGGYEPCGEHRDLYEGMHGISLEDLRAEAAESRIYAAGGEF